MRSTTDVIDAVLADTPHVAQVLADMHEAALAATDPVILELCRLRVAQLLGNGDDFASDLDPALVDAVPQWFDSPVLEPAQRACLAFTEEFVIDVASLTDGTAAAVVAAIGEQGYADFVNALLVIEQRQRLRLAWGRLFPEVVR